LGNHTIDCEFCGQDRRAVGTPCCEEYKKHEEKRLEENRLENERFDTYLKRYGFTGHLSYSFEKKSVIEMLEGLIASGELKERKETMSIQVAARDVG
jgi:hypothetical protein